MTATPSRVLTLVPAHNEAANLPIVIGDLRRHRPDLHILVVDDGSTDGTVALLKQLQVAWLHWPERRGVGSAIRAGLRYAETLGFDVVVRLDADGQHHALDIDRLLGPLQDESADVVVGSRFIGGRDGDRPRPGPVRRTLAAMLTLLTRRPVTDPTSGFLALGPRAVALLAEHHPNGYAEPELSLFLSRNALRVVEVEVRSLARLSGRSSLTPVRLLKAGARVLLAMLIVPLRATVDPARD
jgi:glycosyltransferase involved in cell wall biosynthesis